MDWDDMRIFLAVARAGQISRGAHGLGVDPTTVSRRLRRLEAALGEVLFEQVREGQRLTESGTRLLAVAEAMEHDLARFSPLSDDADGLSGLVRISASEGFGTWFVAPHLATLAAGHPGIAIDLVANSGFLSPSRRETDIAILLARPRKGPIVTRRLTDYGLRLYAARSYIDTHAPIATRDDLASNPLIGYIPDFIYAPELDYLGEIAVGLEPRLRSSSINAQYRLVRSGAGIGVLPCFIGEADPMLSAILPDIRITRSFWLATHRDTRDLPRVRHVVDWLVALTATHKALLLG